MATATQQRLGFGSVKRLAEFLDVSERLVREKAASKEWPSYVVNSKRLFDLDEIFALVKDEKYT